MTDSTFITIDYLKNNTPVPQNMDGDLVRPFIVVAMDKYILPNLGTTMYTKLIEDVKNNSLSGDYLSLMQIYIQPCLAWAVFYDGLSFFATHLTNIGLVNKNSENAQPVEDTRLDKLETKSRQNFEYYSERLIKYLKANYNKFPEMIQDSGELDYIRPVNSQFFNGIHIPNWYDGDKYPTQKP
jgi:hypothetical protein